jgi:hypothetical protein
MMILLLTNVLAKQTDMAAVLSTCVQEFSCSIVAQDADYPLFLRRVSKSLQANDDIVLQLGHAHILPDPFQFTTQQSSNHSTLATQKYKLNPTSSHGTQLWRAGLYW